MSHCAELHATVLKLSGIARNYAEFGNPTYSKRVIKVISIIVLIVIIIPIIKIVIIMIQK